MLQTGPDPVVKFSCVLWDSLNVEWHVRPTAFTVSGS